MSYDDLHHHTRKIAERELTDRQLHVLKATLDGHSTKTIARSMGLAESTVRMHLERALVKMRPHLRKDAA